MASLYKLTNDLKQLQVMLERLDELDETQIDEDGERQAILDTIESVEVVLTDKVDGYCKLIRNIEGNIDEIDNEIKRLQSRKKRKQNHIKWLKENLQNSMETQGKRKVETPLFNVSIAKSGQRKLTPLVEAKDMPEDFVKVEYKVNSKALKDFMKNNGTDCCEYAKLEPATESLRIK